MSRKKSLFVASEAAAAASKEFPFTPWVVIDAPRKEAKLVSAYIYHLQCKNYKARGYRPAFVYFAGKLVKGVYEIRVYDREKLCHSRRDINIGEMVIEADLLTVPDGGHIEIYDEINGKQVYYRERN